jgi:hypothetical protein
MSRFRRRGASGDAEQAADHERPDQPDQADESEFESDRSQDEAGQAPARPTLEVDRSAGPWDVSERPELEGYIDLGALRLPGVDGVEIRLDVEEQTGAVTAATVVLNGSVVQLQAFAAPRSEGIWEEIRTEIAAGISQQGGTADEVPGVFGYELLGQIPARSADGRTVNQAARFTGVDGPRWFLRAVFHGPAAYDAEAAGPLEELVRSVVVVRGGEAMAPRELLALQLPQAVADSAAAAGAAEGGDDGQADQPRYPIDPFERGPEITEVR